ncbi:MAG: 8-oxo-dGTP diphosphatase [Anaerolineae bacterium]|nr:8-oxo-dGTP diphosphatase [Anaerolineae bacterium]
MVKAQLTSHSSYSVIPRTLIFLTSGDNILLLHGAPQKRLWANQYNGIGGQIEAGETPMQSALRELQEETGLTGIALDLRGIIHVTLPTSPGVILFVFVGEASSTSPLRASVEGVPIWIPKDNLATLPLVEDLPQLLPRILSPGPLLFGTYTFIGTELQMTFE